MCADYAGWDSLGRIINQTWTVDGGLTLSYDPDGDNTYAGWDRFGRVIDQRWTNAAGTSVLDRYQYTYDMNSNRLTRTNSLQTCLSEEYTYDGLDRLLTMDRDDEFDQDWTLDALGNWSSFNDDGESQDRDHNEANEIQNIEGEAGWVTPEYDDAGNMTSGPKPGDETTELRFVYDAWNRLVKVTDDSEIPVTIAEYRFDGQGRRIAKTVGETATHFFFNENWQVLETRVGTDPDPLDQYVWDVRYIDAPVVRFHDSNTDGDYLDAEDNTLYYTQDPNWNVTALVDASTGSVVERYMYEPYGKAAVLDEDWDPVQGNESAVDNDRAFQGQQRDPVTGLYWSRVRTDYHPTLAVFLARDGSYIDGSNLYQYCRSNPVALTDPMGLCAENSQAPVFNGVRTITQNKDIRAAFEKVSRSVTGQRLLRLIEMLLPGSKYNEVLINITGQASQQSVCGETEGAIYTDTPDRSWRLVPLGSPVIYISINPDFEVAEDSNASGDSPDDVHLGVRLDQRLFHELVHALQKLRGAVDCAGPYENVSALSKQQLKDRYGDSDQEYEATQEESLYCAEMGYQTRARYRMTDEQRARVRELMEQAERNGDYMPLRERPVFPVDEKAREGLIFQAERFWREGKIAESEERTRWARDLYGGYYPARPSVPIIPE